MTADVDPWKGGLDFSLSACPLYSNVISLWDTTFHPSSGHKISLTRIIFEVSESWNGSPALHKNFPRGPQKMSPLGQCIVWHVFESIINVSLVVPPPPHWRWKDWTSHLSTLGLRREFSAFYKSHLWLYFQLPSEFWPPPSWNLSTELRRQGHYYYFICAPYFAPSLQIWGRSSRAGPSWRSSPPALPCRQLRWSLPRCGLIKIMKWKRHSLYKTPFIRCVLIWVNTPPNSELQIWTKVS